MCKALNLLLLAVLSVSAVAAEKEQEFDPMALRPREFLALARRPFRRNVWGTSKGRISYRNDDDRGRVDLLLRMLFTSESAKVQAVLGYKDVYEVCQSYEAENSSVELKQPRNPELITLDKLGVRPQDFSFSFLYWDFVRERDTEHLRGQLCRVMRLQHPEQDASVVIWFAAKYLFPLRVEWYENGEEKEPWRVCEFTDFKKQADDFWFLKTVKIYGRDWKTKVTLEDAEIFKAEEKPVPPGLFDVRLEDGESEE